MKPFKTHNVQLKILRERGLDVPSRAKRILEKENYYNVINGYKTSFLQQNCSTEKYIVGSHFDEIYSLYNFDRDLRQIFLEYILIFEMHFKSTLAYNFSEKFPESNAYLDFNSYSKDPNKIKTIVRLISTLSNELSKNVSNPNSNRAKNSIEHYIDQHEGVPLWVLTNYLTMGSMSYFYEALDESLRDSIAVYFNDFNKREHKKNISLKADDIQNILKTTTQYRNVCAHGERLYTQRMHKKPRVKNMVNFLDNITVQMLPGNVFTMLALMKFVSSKNDYTCLLRKIDKLIIKHEKEISSIPFTDILYSMGFPSKWKTILLG
ncbi:Abi family protein [Listeria booriae]|uniref:Abi family protein n=1 Tax=Listeria booriae TaxID=1552123 RepID=A0A842CKI1_9LIST|nr:Abi family protein [Listeria booriae]MBC2002368.1 Abi family protein [Listeria booriae]